MAKLRITRSYNVRKSKLTKDSKGNYHCPTCGAFHSGNSGKKKK